jgi:hypothetical protein
VALGRTRTLLLELDAVLKQLRRAGNEAWESNVGVDLRAMYKQVDSTLRFRARGTASPPDPIVVLAGMTPGALRDLFSPMCTNAATLTTLQQVVALYSRRIKRIPNPEFIAQNSPIPGTSIRYLFDRVSAYDYAAQNWGGTHSRLLIGWAANALGELRDPRYVERALEMCPERRTHLIAAMAILAPTNAKDVVLNYARNDVKPAVREAALWTAGLLLGDAATPLVAEAETQDLDANVRRIARRWLSVGHMWWWRV